MVFHMSLITSLLRSIVSVTIMHSLKCNWNYLQNVYVGICKWIYLNYLLSVFIHVNFFFFFFVHAERSKCLRLTLKDNVKESKNAAKPNKRKRKWKKNFMFFMFFVLFKIKTFIFDYHSNFWTDNVSKPALISLFQLPWIRMLFIYFLEGMKNKKKKTKKLVCACDVHRNGISFVQFCHNQLL